MLLNKLGTYIWACLTVLFFTTCQFSPDDLYYVEVEKPMPPELEVIELSLKQDTIFLDYYHDIKFHFSAGDHRVVQVAVLIDGETKYTRSNYKDNFTISCENLSEGYHKLSFSIQTNSNSGSVADLLGYEGYQFLSHEWTLVCVKNNRKSDYAVKTIEGGKLKLSWEPYDKVDFKHYRIAKKHKPYQGVFKEYYTNQPYFIDESYVGEEAYYDIYVEYYSSDQHYFQWAEFEVENTLPEIKIRMAANGKYEMFWEDNAFKEAVGHYRLLNIESPADTILLQENRPFEANSYMVPTGVFGDEIDYLLVVEPSNPENSFNNEDVYYHSKRYKGYLGEKSIQYMDIAPVGENELLLVDYDYGNIYRYWVDSDHPHDSLTFNRDNCHNGYSEFTLSPSGTYFTSLESCNNNLVLMKPERLMNYQSYSTNKVIFEGLRFSSMPVSDNGIVVAKDYNRISVYNVLQDSVLAYYESNDFVGELGISSDGQYFYVVTSQLKFYSVANGIISTVWESAPSYNYQFIARQFDSKNKEHVILYDGTSLIIKNASDFSTVKSFILGEDRIISFDLINRQLLAYTEGVLSVYYIDSGEKIFSVPVNPLIVNETNRCTLAHNKIYTRSGICITVPTN